MKIRVASDLHLEGFNGKTIQALEKLFLPHHENDAQSVLVLAGDISSNLDQLVDFLSAIEPRFKAVLYLPGNHEFYWQDMVTWAKEFDNLAKQKLKNTHYSLLDPVLVVLSNTTFILSTLWAYGGSSLSEKLDVERCLNDFKLISYNKELFTVEKMESLYRRNVNLITSSLSHISTKNTVIVTHHMPSLELCHPRFGSAINGGFASPLDWLLESGDINLWIHGHTHDTIDRFLYSTRVVCNPAGYRRETNSSEHNTYSPMFVDL